jgi:hypothetical protein
MNIEYPHPEIEKDPRQNELNFLAQISLWIYIESVRGNVNQEDYELVQTHIHTQEEWVRKQ